MHYITTYMYTETLKTTDADNNTIRCSMIHVSSKKILKLAAGYYFTAAALVVVLILLIHI